MKPSTTVLMATAVLALVGFTVVPPVSAGESTDVTAPGSFFALRNVEPSAAQALGEADLRAIKGAEVPTLFMFLAGADLQHAGNPQAMVRIIVMPATFGPGGTQVRILGGHSVNVFDKGNKQVQNGVLVWPLRR